MTPDNQDPLTILLVRHGQTEWNANGQWQGWQDSNLTADGVGQAEALAQTLADRRIDVAYASVAGRAMHTARIICGPHAGLEPVPTEALRERNYGDYEGLTTEEIEARYPGTRFDESRDLRDQWRPPGAGSETLAEVGERVMAFLKEAAAKHPGQTALMVAHAGVLRVLDSLTSGQPLEEIWDRVPGNCCLFELEATPDRVTVVQHFCTF